MTAFATADDLAARLGLSFTGDEADRATNLLARASALIQDEARQHVFLVEDDVYTRRGTTDERIPLPERPVVSVASVTLDGLALGENTDWLLDGNDLVRVPITSLIAAGTAIWDATTTFPMGSGFGWERQTLEITYTHGYDDADIPGICREICCEAVLRCIVNPENVARKTIGDVSKVYDNLRFAPTGILLNADEKRALRRFFGRKMQSYTIGT